eukprot:3459370-Rhodomonas_salina.1
MAHSARLKLRLSVVKLELSLSLNPAPPGQRPGLAAAHRRHGRSRSQFTPFCVSSSSSSSKA